MLPHPGHHNQILSRQRDICSQRRALGVYTFLGNLNDHLRTLFQTLLNRDSVPEGLSPAYDFGIIGTRFTEVLRVQVADMKKAVSADTEINKSRLYSRFYVYDFAFVYVADMAAETCSLHVQLFKGTFLHYRDATFFSLGYIYQHFSRHTYRPIYFFQSFYVNTVSGTTRLWEPLKIHF